MREMPSIKQMRIAHFRIASPTTKSGIHLFPPVATEPVRIPTYFWRPLADSAVTDFAQMPILLEPSGGIWVHGCLYLLHRAIDPVRNVPPASATLDSIARDLRIIRECLDAVDCDYLTDSEYQSRRPTYRLKAELKRRIDSGFAPSSANRILSTAKGFYEWLINNKIASFRFPLWRATKVNIQTTNEQGYKFNKLVETSDLSFRILRQSETIKAEYIQDGGKLSPLTFANQREISKALTELGHIEMTLGFLISLTSGARIQSVFTMRLCHFDRQGVADEDRVTLTVGLNGIDSKRNKSYPIQLPGWLYNRVRIYLNSKRAIARRQRCNNIYSNTPNQYVFLTKTGQPYYMGQTDPDRLNQREPPRGGSVRKFISEKLRPYLESKGHHISFSFHDLRASFGMNLVREGIRDIEQGRESMDSLLHYVMTRMGHSRISTTMQYLNHDFARAPAYRAQEQWEKEVAKLTEMGFHQEHLDEDHDNGIDEN